MVRAGGVCSVVAMRIIVHIGTHKTGTTSIQASLRKHAPALAERGLYVPETGTLYKRSGHHNIGWELRGDPRADSQKGGLAELVEELSGVSADSAVISSEDLEYLVEQPDLLTAFDDRLRAAGHDVEYVMLFRRADTYAKSLYAELIYHGLTASFDDFIGAVLDDGKYTYGEDWVYYFDIDSFVRQWTSAVASPLTLVSYEDAQRRGGVVPAFMALIGAPASVVRKAAQAEVLNTRKPARIPALSSMRHSRRLRRRFRGNPAHSLVSPVPPVN